MTSPSVTVGSVTFAAERPFVLIAGPCQMESRDHAMDVAAVLADICAREDVPFVFKTSFDKANRTSLTGRRGVGLTPPLPVFEEVRATFGCPILTDVHEPDQCAAVAPVVDILQIPAFLCRQTDLLVAAAKTGRVVNIKKGQFLAPWDMEHSVAKVTGSGNDRVLLTERGSSFGYNTLVTDMRAFPIMARTTGCPVIVDATHAVQQPGGLGGASGGDRAFAPVIARAAVAVGVAGVFLETHPDPKSAPSDGATMIRLDDMSSLLKTLKALDVIAKAQPLAP